jgi:hypothetical protein
MFLWTDAKLSALLTFTAPATFLVRADDLCDLCDELVKSYCTSAISKAAVLFLEAKKKLHIPFCKVPECCFKKT